MIVKALDSNLINTSHKVALRNLRRPVLYKLFRGGPPESPFQLLSVRTDRQLLARNRDQSLAMSQLLARHRTRQLFIWRGALR